MATPFVWMLPPSCASRSTSMIPSRPMPTTAVMRIGWPNSTSPALKTLRPLTTPTREPLVSSATSPRSVISRM